MDEPVQFGRLGAVSSAMRLVFEALGRLAHTETPVLIEGETGTGKELVGEALHEHGPRSRHPFVVVDCASIPESLIESELFGHVRGAFTGALTDRIGAFEAAHRGSIFIDELGELPLPLQSRLLRVLEQREVKRLGGTGARAVDVRVISATNRDLAREVKEGRFREDLYFRLAVTRVRVPPLRERPEDVLYLAEQFLLDLPTASGTPLEIDPDTRARLLAYAWPGNVRELRNVIDRGAILSDQKLRLPEDFGAALEVGADARAGDDLAPELARDTLDGHGAWPAAETEAARPGEQTRPLWVGRTYKEAKATVLADFERGFIFELLERHRGNVSAAAREAGIHRNVLHRMMARYGITSSGGE